MKRKALSIPGSIVTALLLLLLFVSLCLHADATLNESNKYYFIAKDGSEMMANESSFAVNVVEYTPGSPLPKSIGNQDPDQALGLPDFVSIDDTPESYVCLSKNGQIVLEFGHTFYDADGIDLFVFEIGPSAESILVAVSSDLNTWYDVGKVSGSNTGIDMKGSVPDGMKFRYVRLIDGGKNNYSQPYPGADIDAVCVMPEASDIYRFVDRNGNEVVVPIDSFADSVIEFTAGSPFTTRVKNQNPQVTLGLPDYTSTSDSSYLSMGSGGVLVLGFEEEICDGEGDDIYIFEIGPSVEDTIVEVSSDLKKWYEVGIAEGKTAGLDLNGKVPENMTFAYVRLTDLRTDTAMPTPGADIDAVCGLNTYSRVTKNNVPKDKYCIHVVDVDGKPLKDAKVVYDGVTEHTNAAGNALFALSSAEQPSISVSKDQYMTWTNENSAWEADALRYETVILYPENYSEYILKSARYSTHKSMKPSTDVLTKTKTLNLANDGNLIGDLTDGLFYLSCTASNQSHVSEYELWQNSKLIATSANGKFSPLSVKSFSKGGGCFVRVIGIDGGKMDTKINLQFASNTVNEEWALDLSMDEVSIPVPDSVPYVGGSTLKANLPINLPVTAYVSGSKYRVLINVNLAGGKSNDELFDDVQSSIQDFKVMSRLTPSLAKELKSFIQNTSDVSLVKGMKSGKLQLFGYLECNSGENTLSGQVMLQFSIKLIDGTYNTVVWVVPVTVQFSASFEAGFVGKFSYDLAQRKPTGRLGFDITPKLKAFGGVGFDKALSVGAYGNADLKFEINLVGDPRGLKSVDLTGELGVKAYIAFTEHKRAFAHQTWHLYTKNAASLYGEEESWYAGFADASQYEVSDLSYLQQESEWLGGSMSLLDAEAHTTLTPLLTDTYRNAQPTMTSDGSNLYAAFVRADEESGSRYVSVTRNHDGVWSAPVQVDPNAILDSNPTLCAAPDGTVWLAYARTTADCQNSLLTYAQNQEIVVGTIDPETLAFTEVTAYSGEYVHAPMLTVLSGTPVLSWIDAPVTDENSVLTQSSGTICCAALNGSTWGAASEIAAVDGSIKDYAVGMENGAYSVAYAVDNTLYQVREGQAPAVLTDAFSGAVRYGVLPGTDAAAFLWNGEDVINSSDGTTVPVEGIRSEFAISGNHIYYSMDTDGSADLAFLQYDAHSGTWSLPMILTDGDRYLENLNVSSMNGQDYVLGMHTAVMISEDLVADAKNLVWARVMPVSNLRIDDVSYNKKGLEAGDTVPVSITVTNAGDHTIKKIDLDLNGSLLTSQSCNLLPGESMEIETSLVCPSSLTSFSFQAEESGETDYSPEDNTWDMKIGYADVQADLEYQQIGDSKFLKAAVTNCGVETASGKIIFYDCEGNAVAASSFDHLSAGDNHIAIYEIGDYFAGINGGTVSAEVVLDQEEFYTYNNRATVTILEPQTTIRSFDGESASVYCNTDTDAAAICAFYDAAGKMLQSQRMTLEAGKLNTLTFAPPEGAVSAKLCVLDPVNGWKPLTAAMEHSI